MNQERYKPSLIELYGLWGLIKLGVSLIRTKMFFPSAKLFRFPIEIRGRKYIDFGKNLSIGRGSKIEAYPYLNQGKIIKFGKNVGMNDYAHITGIQSITIGDNVLMAGKIYISDSNHGTYQGGLEDSVPDSLVRLRKMSGKPIVIEENVWLGEAVSVLGGVTIGKNSIIGAHSVVSKDIPPNTIAAGVPARPIKRFDFKTNKWERL